MHHKLKLKLLSSFFCAIIFANLALGQDSTISEDEINSVVTNDSTNDTAVKTIPGSALVKGSPTTTAISGTVNRAGIFFGMPFPSDSLDFWHLPDTADWPFHQDLSGIFSIEQLYSSSDVRDYRLELREYLTSARNNVEFTIPLTQAVGASIPNLNRDRYYSLVIVYQDNGIPNPALVADIGSYSIQFSITAGVDSGSGSIGLPVEWLSFDAALVDQNVNLSWSTAAEENNRGFYVERSQDAEIWEELGFVEGAGTTEEIRDYSFIVDRTPSIGYNYYRIRQVDYNGDTDYSVIRESHPRPWCICRRA